MTAKRTDSSAGRSMRILLVICLVSTAVLTAVVWLVPRPIGDLYVALAAGRDIISTGRVAVPDTWAFTTEGRVWINQNWLTGVVYYLCHAACGETGLLLLKAAILVAIVFFIAMAARQRGVDWPLAFLAGGGMLLACRSYIDLRPNLSSLMFAPLVLWLLYRSGRHRRGIWIVAGVTGLLWANFHGGFIFGLGMMGLWAGCRILAAMMQDGFAKALRRQWREPATTVAAVVLAGVASPFGLTNLSHPLLVTGSSFWRYVPEWRPIFSLRPAPALTTWEFFIVLGVLVLSAVLWLGRSGKRKSNAQATGRELGEFAFDAILGAVVIIMAFRSRRFIPLANIILAPTLAVLLHGVLRPRRHIAPSVVAASLILLPGLYYGVGLLRHYRSDNPVYAPESFLQRMIVRSFKFAPDAVDFINANKISGRVFNEWRWEGYLRWHCPQLRLFVGGRAQQVHDQQIVQLGEQIYLNKDPAAILRKEGIHLVVVPIGHLANKALNILTYSRGAHWTYIYCDGVAVVLADARCPETRKLIKSVIAGQLKYPTAGIAALSLAKCLTSPASGADVKAAVEATKKANELQPTYVGYTSMGYLAFDRGYDKRKLIDYLEARRRSLAKMIPDRSGYLKVLRARSAAGRVLAALYRAIGLSSNAYDCDREVAKLDRQTRELVAKWQ